MHQIIVLIYIPSFPPPLLWIIIEILITFLMFIRSLRPKTAFSGFRPKGFRSAPRFSFSTSLVQPGKERLVGGWLFLSAAGVLGMIVLGGYTRLTHSGLSMADWSPYTKRYPRNTEEWNV